MDDKFKTFVCTSASLLVEAISSSYMCLHPSISSYLNVHFSFTFSHVLWLSYLSFHFLQVLFIHFICLDSVAFLLFHFVLQRLAVSMLIYTLTKMADWFRDIRLRWFTYSRLHDSFSKSGPFCTFGGRSRFFGSWYVIIAAWSVIWIFLYLKHIYILHIMYVYVFNVKVHICSKNIWYTCSIRILRCSSLT